MRFLLPFLSLSALAFSLPTWHQGPFISDDENLMERRDLYKVEIVQAQSSRFTNTIVTKITKYASDVQGYLAESFKGAVADSNGEVMAISYKKKIPMAVGRITRHGHKTHNRHRISLLGFRNRLAFFILAFAVVLAFACSYLRRIYLASLRPESDHFKLESAISEKPSPETTRQDAVMES
ncbi:hypothetical protein E4U41_001754 [Claviceps citrina]|nr:hypothetical protein E4U41_001754 [Claviceps citrina]